MLVGYEVILLYLASLGALVLGGPRPVVGRSVAFETARAIAPAAQADRRRVNN